MRALLAVVFAAVVVSIAATYALSNLFGKDWNPEDLVSKPKYRITYQLDG